MVIHDYMTSISCDNCSKEIQIEQNLKEKTIRKIAERKGWLIVDGKDICPDCASKRKGEQHE